jgi:hypothetical protein
VCLLNATCSLVQFAVILVTAAAAATVYCHSAATTGTGSSESLPLRLREALRGGSAVLLARH